MTRAWVLVLLVLPALAGASNALKDHPSPYLALHGGDPVEWRDWGDAALEEARRLNRPLFISSGYFACHWCHVMQRESYRDDEIALLLNTNFVPVKLDRELNPALDDHLIRFVERTRGQAGWPLNVFLSPEGYPMLGLTYLPPQDFRLVLSRVADQWRVRPDTLSTLARDGARELYDEPDAPDPSAPLPDAAVVLQRLREGALDVADELGGGFGQQNKFPMEPQLLALLEVQARAPDRRLGAFLDLTLAQMASRGLRDHLAGGFFRYTVDPDWRTPHFEKMLYNQALLALVYLRASMVLGEPAFRDVARDTLDFVLGHMQGQNGGFIASLSAVDAAGNEGGSYLWHDADLDRALSPAERRIAVAWWSLEPAASPADGLLPQRLRTPAQAATAAGVAEDEIQRRVAEIRDKLLMARADRAPPRDTKQLAAWNGLMLWALAEAAAALGEPRYAQAAGGVAGFLRTLWDGERLYRARDGVRILGDASLEDYALVAAGFAAWTRVTDDGDDRQMARRIAAAGWDHFFDEAAGWRMDSAARLPAMPRDAAMQDGALPAPSGILMLLAMAPGADVPDGRLPAAKALSAGPVRDAAFWHASHALALLNDVR